MAPLRASRSPSWYGIPVRVLLLTFIGTLLCFAVSLLLAIFGTVIVSALHGVHPDMRVAYRHIALPIALVAGGIILILTVVMEIRHYRQAQTLTAIERLAGVPTEGARPRIAIPMPHSSDRKYSERAIVQYERAVSLAGGEPVRIPLDQNPTVVRKMVDSCDAVLLPGSNADVDPAKFQQPRSVHTAAADPGRDQVDELLLHDAYTQRKPVLGICYGLQSLNVFRKGSLVQHIPDFLPEAARAKVDHSPGRKVAVAHNVEIVPDSKLAKVVAGEPAPDSASPSSEVQRPIVMPVNSSHHQSAAAAGDGLRIVARCPDDGVIEAVEGTSPNHFVLAVQWHPERSVDEKEESRAIFVALVEAAKRFRNPVNE